MIALLVPEISPGVGFCDVQEQHEEEELGILVGFVVLLLQSVFVFVLLVHFGFLCIY